MEIGVSIGPHVDQIEDISPEFDFVELSVGEGDTRLRDIDRKELQEILDEKGFGIVIHLPFLQNLVTDVDIFNNAVIDYMENLIDFASEIGAMKTVAHVDTRNYLMDKRTRIREQIEDMHELGVMRDIEVCFENAGNFGMIRPIELADLVEEVGAKMCFDTGHMYAFHGQDMSETFLLEMQEMISHLHVSDTRKEQDLHLPPGCGEIDFESLLGHLEDFEGSVTLELKVDDNDYRDLAREKLLDWL
ncbi:MAG: sugar phosphate isomerase/epimerase family protein [Candidatus Nanohaloarchaea archaeon]|nr:sugar phosphate isomerase/epimerase family protein [Candidatus Nanohaloarchaea archaeon]